MALNAEELYYELREVVENFGGRITGEVDDLLGQAADLATQIPVKWGVRYQFEYDELEDPPCFVDILITVMAVTKEKALELATDHMVAAMGYDPKPIKVVTVD